MSQFFNRLPGVLALLLLTAALFYAGGAFAQEAALRGGLPTGATPIGASSSWAHTDTARAEEALKRQKAEAARRLIMRDDKKAEGVVGKLITRADRTENPHEAAAFLVVCVVDRRTDGEALSSS